MKILIISEYIAPKQTIGSVRWTKIAKYLKKNHGIDIDVLTTKNVEWDEDKLLINDMSNFSDYGVFNKDIVSTALTKYFNQKSQKGWIHNTLNVSISSQQKEDEYEQDTLKHRIRVFLQEFGMRATARKAFTKYKEMNKQYDVIISSYGPIWCHLVAHKIKNSNEKAYWLADFRDIFAGNKYESRRDFERHRRFAGQFLNKANIITKVAPDVDLYENNSQKVIVLPNGYDLEEAVGALPPEKFSFVYTGTMYEGETELIPIFQAISELVESSQLDKKDIVIEYAGRSSWLFNHQIQASSTNIAVIDHGSVPREQALELQQKSAILMQASSYDTKFKPLWTGKMFEYMMIKKPIIYALKTTEHSRIADEMHYIGGMVYESCYPDSIESIKKYIIEKYKQWKITGDVSIEQDIQYVASFSYEHISEEVWKIINQ